ncbi:MAG: sigma-54 dependent transcriptional regulator [Pseudomonadota bacterium]|nr:sigma-54 dependent transcriptional regulator [Pseudomonadota bacterium]
MNLENNIINGDSPGLMEVLRAADLVAVTDVAVLITGETGTGKDLLAQRIHKNSRRHDKPFITVNCASLPESLAESLLFGHLQGAFTGAASPRKGFIAEADGGTLLLDEIGEMPAAVQAKLLRFLESGEYQPLGTVDARHANVRLIAATNCKLLDAVKAGTFRHDLYFRLNVVPLEVPPLRMRTGDLAQLLQALNDKLSNEHELQAPDYTEAAIRRMERYSWPGNIRELRNFLERMMILFNGGVVDVSNLPMEMIPESPSSIVDLFKLPADGVDLESLEIGLMNQALNASNGNKSRAARMLGLTRDTFLYRLKKYAL